MSGLDFGSLGRLENRPFRPSAGQIHSAAFAEARPAEFAPREAAPSASESPRWSFAAPPPAPAPRAARRRWDHYRAQPSDLRHPPGLPHLPRQPPAAAWRADRWPVRPAANRRVVVFLVAPVTPTAGVGSPRVRR